jgi:glycosyltransferase involved in cell wall biosynthesis
MPATLAPSAPACPLTHLGAPAPEPLAGRRQRAGVAIVPALTHAVGPALELVACGLPVVAVDTPAARDALPGAALLVPPDPLALAAAAEHLLDDLDARAAQVRAGLEATAQRPWAKAVGAIEAALRPV